MLTLKTKGRILLGLSIVWAILTLITLILATMNYNDQLKLSQAQQVITEGSQLQIVTRQIAGQIAQAAPKDPEMNDLLIKYKLGPVDVAPVVSPNSNP